MLECNGCGNKQAHATKTWYDDEFVKHEVCDSCGGLTTVVGMPDVYLGSHGGLQTDENIVDPVTKKEIPFSTKKEKKEAMKRAGVEQSPLAEDRNHPMWRPYTGKKKLYFI